MLNAWQVKLSAEFTVSKFIAEIRWFKNKMLANLMLFISLMNSAYE
ncbi:hypothetical protein JYB87_12375 [Shewanella avicenniae]|uniref:Transposase n=1 Tax=Shewanella avicenniae TaxID=2814294 RepID=A0ABX7QPB6_9GAMM|nr:hypothetical protein [Shewanella avicenniae]QSX32556.1 hypothetical protein JYB87_12375 [Shewanella avicenniae]